MEHDRNKIFIEIVFLISVEFLHLKLWAVSPRLICQYVDTQPTRAQPLLLLTSFYMGTIPDICNFFSTDTIFGSTFRHAKARNSRQSSVNRKKTDFATKYCKMRQNTINCTHYFSTFQIFFTFLMWRIFSI